MGVVLAAARLEPPALNQVFRVEQTTADGA